jgi:hypothetical protein
LRASKASGAGEAAWAASFARAIMRRRSAQESWGRGVGGGERGRGCG